MSTKNYFVGQRLFGKRTNTSKGIERFLFLMYTRLIESVKNMFARVKNGCVEVYDGNDIPVVCFGHGENIVSIVVQGNDIICSCKNGTTHIWEFNNGRVNQTSSF